ncbi:MAG: hypothetical protein JXQ23_03255 [Clostridia bacterium]|nr:hypothetical protein [Clostridia bacterium]
MKALFFVLNDTDKLDEVMTAFVRKNICGATIIESVGMARILSNKHLENEIPFIGSLRAFLSPEREKSNVIFSVIQDEQLNDAVEAIESVVGDLWNKGAGVVFSIPIDFAKGFFGCGK